MGTLSRTTWTDDDGTGTTGSIINANELSKIYDAVEGDLKSASNPTVSTKSIQDAAIAGFVAYQFGGNRDSIVSATAIVSGTAQSALLDHSRKLSLDSALTATGSWRLRAFGKSAGGGTGTLGLYNLTDSPNSAPIATITTDSDDAGQVKTSSAITWPASGTSKSYGLKPLVSGAGVEAGFDLVELVRVS